MRTGHDLVREIINKHGVDRYPAPMTALLKVLEESGELSKEINTPYPNANKIAKEYGDVGLALYGLGDKLGLNLQECMENVVDNETRVFA